MGASLEAIKNISIASASEFLKSTEADANLNDIISEKLKSSDFKKVSKEEVARIVNATNHMVNLSILRKDSHTSDIDQMITFDLAEVDTIISKLNNSEDSSMKKNSSEGVTESDNPDITLKAENLFIVTPEEVEANMKDYVSLMVSTLKDTTPKDVEESVETAFQAIDDMEDNLVKVSKVVFADGYKSAIRAFEIAESIFGRKHSEDAEENEKICRKLFKASEAELESLFNHLRMRMYKKSAEGYYDSDEVREAIRKISAPWAALGAGAVGSNVLGSATKGGVGEFFKYPGQAAGYATFKDWFDVGTRIRAEDLAAQTAVSSTVKEITGAGVQYGLGIMDKFFRSLSNKVRSITQMGTRQKLIGEILQESRELAVNANPDDLSEWYSALMTVAPEMSLNKAFTKGFLLQAAGIGQVSADMLQKAAQLEKTVAETGIAGATQMKIMI